MGAPLWSSSERAHGKPTAVHHRAGAKRSAGASAPKVSQSSAGAPEGSSHAPARRSSYENTLNHHPKTVFTSGVSLPRRQASAAFFTTSPCVG